MGFLANAARKAANGMPAVSPPAHHVDLVPADLLFDRLQRMVHDARPRLGVGNQLSAVDIDRARPARGEDVRIVRPAVDGLDLEQQPRRIAGFRRAGRRAEIALPFNLLAAGFTPGCEPGAAAFFFVAMLLVPLPRAACDKMTAVCLAFIHRTGNVNRR